MRNISFSLFIALSAACIANAGALFPCVNAVSSKNGTSMVIVDHNTLSVFSKETFVNETQRLNAPATFWNRSWNGWSVILKSDELHNEPECPLPLITDGGEFMILVSTGPLPGKSAVALQIYRRRDHNGDPVREGPDHGVFIKSIRIDQIWPPDKVAKNTGAWDDGTPEWFAGGDFDFRNNAELIHTTRWGKTIRIDLATGFVIPTPAK